MHLCQRWQIYLKGLWRVCVFTFQVLYKYLNDYFIIVFIVYINKSKTIGLKDVEICTVAIIYIFRRQLGYVFHFLI